MTTAAKDSLTKWLPSVIVVLSIVAQWAVYGYRLDLLERQTVVNTNHASISEFHLTHDQRRATVKNELHPVEIDVALLRSNISEIKVTLAKIEDKLESVIKNTN